MTPRKRRTRIYWRGGRAYGDFRDYANVGGGRERLCAAGERQATTDPDVASALVTLRLAELEQRRRLTTLTGQAPADAFLEDVCGRYLVARGRSGNVTDGWLAACEGFLSRAVAFFGRERPLESISVGHVREWSAMLLTTRTTRGKRLGPESVRRHLFTLSAVFKYAAEHELVPSHCNPVARFSDKPARSQREAKWLEAPDAALLLECARTLPDQARAIRADVAHPLLATFLLTGGRKSEILGLTLDDVSMDRRTITIRPNAFRPRLKTPRSERVVPIVPQLYAILGAYLFGPRLDMGGRLLFPSFVNGDEQMLVDVRKMIDRAALRGGWRRRELNLRMFRHTWCAARLQTLDHGAPVSPWTVAREMGHSSDELVMRIYSHLGTMRHRAEYVEFIAAHYADELAGRLPPGVFVTTIDTKVSDDDRSDMRDAVEEVLTGSDDETWRGDVARARRDSNARPLAPEASALSS